MTTYTIREGSRIVWQGQGPTEAYSRFAAASERATAEVTMSDADGCVIFESEAKA